MNIDDLAIFSNHPMFAAPLHVGYPNIGNKEAFFSRVEDIFDRRWLTNDGPFVHELEGKLADYLGVKHCVAVCNATLGLEIAARALGLEGEVILPSFTFVATAHALQWQALTPVFCDIDPFTHNIDSNKVAELITPKTTAILGVHTWGRACEVGSLTNIAKKNKLALFFDAAHAFACSHQNKMIGNFGDAEVFSFHATKFFNSFEGGAIVTNDDSLAQKMKEMRNFGFAGIDKVVEVGINAKMSEISAAMALTSFESLNDFIAINYENYLLYKDNLNEVPGVDIVTYSECEKNNYQYIVIEIDEQITGLSRDALVKILNAENVLARRYFYPGVHQMEPYISYFPNAKLLLPETERLTRRVLQLPTGTAIDQDKITRVCDIIRFSMENASSINQQLKR